MLSHCEKSKHSLAMNLKSTMIWCYVCDDEVVDAGTDAVRKLVIDLVALNNKKNKGLTERETNVIPKGLKGLANIGNTCFLAASMQCLSHTVAFQKQLRHCPPYSKEELQSPTAAQRLVVAVGNFFENQWTRGGQSTLSPDEILSAVQRMNALFHGYQQHDSQEFLRFLLSTIHEELRQRKDEKSNWNSLVSDVFMGKTCSTVTCLKCRKESKCVEDFYDLSLPIPSESFPLEQVQRVLKGLEDPQAPTVNPVSTSAWLWNKTKSVLGLAQDSKVSVTDCLVQFMRTEKLTGTDAYFCEQCKVKTDCLKRMSIKQLPEVLVVHLKRFRHDWGSTKVGKLVSFPVTSELDLTPFVELAQEGGNPLSRYQVTAIVQHIGSIGSGHYVSYCKHKTSGQWYLFDDSRVSLVSNPASVEQTEAYVLFFQRVPDPSVLKNRRLLNEAIVNVSGKTELVPTKWIAQTKTLSSVPRLTAEFVVCSHNRPSTACPVHAKLLFRPVSAEYANRIRRKYAMDDYVPPESLDTCKICEQYIAAYNHRLSLEHKLVTKLDTKNINEGESWHFIDANWVTSWRQYLRHAAIADSNKACSPGPLNTEQLAGKLTKAPKEEIAKLKLTSDFIAVNRNVWTVFVHCHGSDGRMIVGPTLDIAEAKIVKTAPLGSVLELAQISSEDWERLSHEFVDMQRGIRPDAVQEP